MRIIGTLFGLAIAISIILIFEVQDSLASFLLGMGLGGLGTMIGGSQRR